MPSGHSNRLLVLLALCVPATCFTSPRLLRHGVTRVLPPRAYDEEQPRVPATCFTSPRLHRRGVTATRSWPPRAFDEEPPAEERRLVPRTDDPRLFWLDEIFDTPSERRERDRLKEENKMKWAKIMMDEELMPAQEQAKIYGLPPEWVIVAVCVPFLLAGLSRFGH